MRLIKPKQISGDIMTLIEEADEKMIFISPYYNISKWSKLLNPLNTLQERKVAVEFYVREGEAPSIREVESIGYKAFPIKNLHSKIYLNEKHAIITSMNLNSSSDSHSLDVGMITETKEEYDEVFQHYERYYKREAQAQQSSANPKKFFNWKEELDNRLEESLKRNVYIKNLHDCIQIQAGNRYEALVGTDFGNELFISGVLSSKEFAFAKANKVFQSNKMAIYLKAGGNSNNGYMYDLVCGRMSGLKSKSIHNIQPGEQELIIGSIHRFIVGVEEFKKMVR